MIKKKNNSKIDHFLINKIEEALENNTSLPWTKPWVSHSPENYVSKNKYRGVNELLLSWYGGSPSNYFITFNQTKKLGGKIKKDSVGLPIVFFKVEYEEVENEKDGTIERKVKRFIRRYSFAFRIEDTDLEIPKRENVLEESKIRLSSQLEELIEKKAASLNTKIVREENAVCKFTPLLNTITIVNAANFNKDGEFDANEYYSSFIHELSHAYLWSLKQKEDLKLSYAVEEAIVEMAATQICSNYDFYKEPDNAIAYITTWLQRAKKFSMESIIKKALDIVEWFFE